MSKIGYREIGGFSGALSQLREFENYTGSMSANWSHIWIDGNHTRLVYQVFSYSTLMAIYDPLTGTLYYNEGSYSTTTARQQTLIRAWAGCRSRLYEVPCSDPSVIIKVWHSEMMERKIA